MNFVIPSNIPWEEFKGAKLEELVYWLLDDMGAKDLVWRKGGQEVTSADGGRDIEATFHVPTLGGEMEQQRCWVEIKGRTKTVEAATVKESIINVSGRKDVDVFYFITNTQYSNPTRDWVTDWQKNNPRPKVRLWDKDSLERMISKHPSVVVRVYSDALSDQGKLEASTSRFWNQMYFPSKSDLDMFWANRETLEWSSRSLYMVISGEIANGSLSKHSWLTKIEQGDLALLLIDALSNTLFLYLRAQKLGQNCELIIRTTSQILMASLLQIPEEWLNKIVHDPWEFTEGGPMDRELHKLIIEPILGTIRTELSDVCCTNCRKVLADPVLLNKNEIAEYWNKFIHNETPENDEKNQKVLILQSLVEPCRIGIMDDLKESCPLYSDDELSLKDELILYKTIINRHLLDLEEHEE